MPHGHNRQYLELVEEAQNKRIQISRDQQKRIATQYEDIAKDLAQSLTKRSAKSLSYRRIKDYAEVLKRESKILHKRIDEIVSDGVLQTAQVTTGVQESLYSGLCPELSERFQDVFSKVPQQIVDELMSGGVYEDFTGLSERIWNYKGKFDRDIGYVINQGILQKKPAFELAKDLETYLRPGAKKPFEWSKVYPRANQMVDYNAQRLARTSVTHAYQMSFQRSTRNNPFVEKYQWLSSNGSGICDICRERDGQYFAKDRLPLDHPNGKCTVVAVIPKDFEQIGKELGDWAAGEENPDIDRWLGPNKAKTPEKLQIKNASSVSGETRKRLDAEMSLIPEGHRDIIEAELKEVAIIKDGNSRYDREKGVLYIRSDFEAGEAIHEMAHALETAHGIYSDPEFIAAMAETLGDINPLFDVIEDSETFVKPIQRLDLDALLSEYQGRVYEDVGAIGEDFKFNMLSLGDFFSEAYREYIKNPGNLKKKQPKIYEYIRKIKRRK